MRPALLAALVLACKAPSMAAPDFKPTLDLSPTQAQAAPGASVVFHAAMNYPEGIRYIRQPVRWDVMEKDGGSITMNGVYTAPATAGTFHVRVTRTDEAGQGLSRTATVTVK